MHKFYNKETVVKNQIIKNESKHTVGGHIVDIYLRPGISRDKCRILSCHRTERPRCPNFRHIFRKPPTKIVHTILTRKPRNHIALWKLSVSLFDILFTAEEKRVELLMNIQVHNNWSFLGRVGQGSGRFSTVCKGPCKSLLEGECVNVRTRIKKKKKTNHVKRHATYLRMWWATVHKSKNSELVIWSRILPAKFKLNSDRNVPTPVAH